MPEPTWQEVLLSQGLLIVGALVRFIVAWLAVHTMRLSDPEGE